MVARHYKMTAARFSSTAQPDDWHELVQQYGRVGCWTALAEESIVWWSKGVYDLYAVPYDLQHTPDLFDFFQEGFGEHIMAALGKAVATGEGWSISAPFMDANGKRLRVLSTGSARRTPEGRLVIFGCFQDITAFHELQSEALETKNFIESIFDNIPQMITVKDAKDLRIVRVNKQAEIFLGESAADIVGKSDSELFPANIASQKIAQDRKALQANGTVDIPLERVTASSGERILHSSKVALKSAEGVPTFLLQISEDITERIVEEKVIEDQRTALLASARLSSLGQMAGGIAHEINNPLSIIKAGSDQIELLLSRPNIDIDRLRSLSGTITKTVDRIAKIVSGLRDFSRDGVRDPSEPVSVMQVVQDTLALCGEKIRFSGVRVDCQDVANDLKIDCQSVRIAQVLLNLITNAYDATMQSNPKEKVIKISTSITKNGGVEIVVQDRGSGVPKNLADSIMEPFFTTKGPGKGTGLGLSISKSICADHEGTLTLRPSPVGACFVISLPASRVVRRAAA